MITPVHAVAHLLFCSPKSVLLPLLMRNDSVGVSHLTPCLFKHNQVRYSLTAMFFIDRQHLSGKPMFVFSQSCTRPSKTSWKPTSFTSVSRLFYVHRDLCRRRPAGRKEINWSDEATTVNYLC